MPIKYDKSEERRTRIVGECQLNWRERETLYFVLPDVAHTGDSIPKSVSIKTIEGKSS